MPYFPSEEELDQRAQSGDFELMPEESYKLRVREISIQENKVNQYNEDGHDTLKVVLDIVSFADDQPAVDVTGADAVDRRFWDFIDPTKIGTKPQYAKARKFFTACLGLPVASGFDIEDYQDLVGKTLIGDSVIQEKKGVERNKIISYKAVRARPARRAPAAAETVETEAVAAAAPKKATKRVAEAKKDENIDLVAKGRELFELDDEDPF